MSVGPFTIDCIAQKVKKYQSFVTLTKKEFALLEYLFRNRGIVLSRSLLLEHVWNKSADPFSNTIETHIRSIRRKLDVQKNELIISISGRGYKII
jgi:DNA-binding response OmpR family regulator